MASLIDFDDRTIMKIENQQNWFFLAVPGINQAIIAKGNRIEGMEAE